MDRPFASNMEISRLPCPEKGLRLARDGDVRGFGVRIPSAGAHSFIFNYWKCRVYSRPTHGFRLCEHGGRNIR